MGELSGSEEVSGEEESGDEVSEEESESEEEQVAPPPPKRSKGGKAKKFKDENKPKRNMSSFFLYSNANRSRIKEENPGTAFGQIAKLLSEEYKQLTPEEKKKWEKEAAKDKLRYDREMEYYVPPDGVKKRKKDKDPNKPKRNMSAYFLFSNASRASIKERNPDASFRQLAKLISEEFKCLSDKERKTWDKKAAADKVRYEEEMKVYKGT